MEISNVGLALIEKYEGFRDILHNDPADNCSIGIGQLVHLGRCDGRAEEAPYKNGISHEAALALLKRRVTNEYGRYVNEIVTAPLTQGQFDALVSLCYNCGPGKVRELCTQYGLNNGDYQRAGEAIRSICVYGTDGVKYQGLVDRRNEEADLFIASIKPDTPPDGYEWAVVSYADKSGVNVRRSPAKIGTSNVIASATNGTRLMVSKEAEGGFRKVMAYIHESVIRPDFGVPYNSQNGPTAPDRNDCGPACGSMLAAWQGKYFTVREVVDAYVRQTPSWTRGTFTSLGQALLWFKSIGINAQILNRINGIGILFVHYSLLPPKHQFDPVFARAPLDRDGHFVVHLGKGYVHDPLWNGDDGRMRYWGEDVVNKVFGGWFLEVLPNA